MAQNFPENLMEKNKINTAVDFTWVTFCSPVCQGRIAGSTAWLCHTEVWLSMASELEVTYTEGIGDAPSNGDT